MSGAGVRAAPAAAADGSSLACQRRPPAAAAAAASGRRWGCPISRTRTHVRHEGGRSARRHPRRGRFCAGRPVGPPPAAGRLSPAQPTRPAPPTGNFRDGGLFAEPAVRGATAGGGELARRRRRTTFSGTYLPQRSGLATRRQLPKSGITSRISEIIVRSFHDNWAIYGPRNG